MDLRSASTAASVLTPVEAVRSTADRRSGPTAGQWCGIGVWGASIRRRFGVICLAYWCGGCTLAATGFSVFGRGFRSRDLRSASTAASVLTPVEAVRSTADRRSVADCAFHHATHAHSRSVQATAQHQTQVHAAETHAPKLRANEQAPQHEAQTNATIRLRLMIR